MRGVFDDKTRPFFIHRLASQEEASGNEWLQNRVGRKGRKEEKKGGFPAQCCVSLLGTKKVYDPPILSFASFCLERGEE
jgi:hypothetical protein